MEPDLARTIWHRLETINAVSYFSPEAREGPEHIGLKGFWMGYFACRAAPMGPVPASVVEATFFNFHPDRVRRAIPDAWDLAEPTDILGARSTAASTAIRRLLGDASAEKLATEQIPVLDIVIDVAASVGRPLFAANREVARSGDVVANLWQCATTFREQRGDAHVALLTGAGLSGCEVLVLFSACEGVDGDLFRQSRGWSSEEWDMASEQLASRGILDGDGDPTPAGRELRDEIERRTDELAAVPYGALKPKALDRLIEAVESATLTIAVAGEIRYPNPMGLPSVAVEA